LTDRRPKGFKGDRSNQHLVSLLDASLSIDNVPRLAGFRTVDSGRKVANLTGFWIHSGTGQK
jgi:hypothetical protein